MRYNRGHVKNHLSNKKHIAIYALCLLLIGSVFFYSNTITGYVTYTASLEEESSKAKSDLAACKTDKSAAETGLASCQTDLQTASSDLQAAQSDLSSCESSLFGASASVSECSAEKSALEQQSQELGSNYDALATNSAKLVCCRPGVATTSWDVANHSIVCTGIRTLNCTA